MVDLERVGEEVQDGLWSRYWEKGWGEMGAGAEGRVRDGGASELRKSKAVSVLTGQTLQHSGFSPTPPGQSEAPAGKQVRKLCGWM